MSEFEKERAIHDYIVLNTRYDKENYDNNTVPEDSHNVYGVLIKGVGVCQGYSESMKLLLNRIDIDCIVVSAPEMNHAWNIVTIDGEKYHVDVTWNDPILDRKKYVSYRYLNVPDERMKETHTWNYSRYPSCTSDIYSFLWNISSPRNIDNYIYYSNNEENKEYIYRLNLDTFEKEQITIARAPYFDIAGEWIYFSNYSNGGYLYKIKLDGTGLTLLDNVHSVDIYKEGNYIYYMGKDSGTIKKIEVESEPEEEPEEDEPEEEKPEDSREDESEDSIESGEDYTGYKKWEEILNVIPSKDWTIKFSQPLDENYADNRYIYIKDKNGNLFTDVDINIVDDITLSITPTKDYSSDIYYLYIENLKSNTGKALKENVKMKFTVKEKENKNQKQRYDFVGDDDFSIEGY